MSNMQINVAQLLKEPTGSSRTTALDHTVCLEQNEASHVCGQAELLRVAKGVLVRGTFTVERRLICSRCLTLFPQALVFSAEEEFCPSIDVISGNTLPLPEDSTTFTIDEHHILDMTELVRQHSLLAAPMKPLCKPDCAGLCPHCGADLNRKPCHCAANIETPFSVAFNKLKSARKSR